MSIDQFLGGKISLEQPQKGFRAGTDTILLAAAVNASPAQTVYELGVGSGVALCALGARVSRLSLYGTELIEENQERANRNIENQGFEGYVFCGDALAPPEEIRVMQFDHVLFNPPFFAENRHTAPVQAEKAHAHIAQAGLADWMNAACKRAKPKGSITAIAPAQALPELLAGVQDSGALRILPIATKEGEPAKRVIVRAIRQSRQPLQLLPPLILRDQSGQPTARAEEITRAGGGIYELWR